MRRTLWLAVLAFFLSTTALAQVRPIPLQQRVDEAEIIVEATVVESTPFMNPAGTMIYTSHRLRVYKALKLGGVAAEQLHHLELVTPGGRLGDQMHVVTPALELAPNDTGLFFVAMRRNYAGLPEAWVPSESTQSFIEYDASGRTASDPFHEYAGVRETLYEPIRRWTGGPYLELEAFDATLPRGISIPRRRTLRLSSTSSGALAPTSHSITSLVPGTVRAGIKEALTINGSGFGALTGAATVFFDEADDGSGGSFGSVDAEHIISWSDTQIQLYVPNRSGGTTAGTGKVIVVDSSGAQAISPSDLTVTYALREVLSSGVLYRLSAENENVRGGYTFRYSTSTASNGVDFTSNPSAMARFEAALGTWNCATGWNSDADGTTSVNSTGNDGVNVVTFDNDLDPLAGSTLGRASVFFSSCGGDSWYVNGVDIRFRRDGVGVDWYFGSDPGGQGPSEADFESFALHEIGHTVQHGHINDTSDVMHYSLTNGTSSRVLSAGNTAGGLDIVSYSGPYASCGKTGMLSFDCAAAPAAAFGASALGACGSSLSVDFTDYSQNGPTSWSWTFGDAGVSSARNPSHTYTTQGAFSVSLTASNTNGSDLESKESLIVLTDAPVAASCAPTFTGHNDCCSIGIKNVTLNTIDHSTETVSEGDPFHEDFTCSQFTILEASQMYAISVTTGSFNSEDVQVYVDWDADGVLEAGELVFSSENTPIVHSGSFTVPAAAVAGTALRMRVLSDFESGTIAGPCDNIGFGQVEDYSVLVAAPAGSPGVIPNGSLMVDKNPGDPTKLDLSWSPTCGSAADYTIHEGEIDMWYSHSGLVCTTGGATSIDSVTPGSDDRYYLVVPVTTTDEGSYGLDSSSVERPVSTTTCRTTQDTTTCP